jgi:hypothetical protein
MDKRRLAARGWSVRELMRARKEALKDRRTVKDARPTTHDRRSESGFRSIAGLVDEDGVPKHRI